MEVGGEHAEPMVQVDGVALVIEPIRQHDPPARRRHDRVAHARAQIEPAGATTAVVVDGLTTPVVLSHLEVRAASGTTAGESSVALRVSGASCVVGVPDEQATNTTAAHSAPAPQRIPPCPARFGMRMC